MKLLIAAGANVNSVAIFLNESGNNKQVTALTLAHKERNAEIENLLKVAGAIE